MIKEDVIEGIVGLPTKLFYGTGIPGCVLILNKNKPTKRKNKIIFIYAARDYEEGKVRNLLRESDVKKIDSAFTKYEEINGYSHIADLEELRENEFNLNVPRYVDISETEEEIDIQKTIDDIKNLEKKKQEIETQVVKNLKELGFNI